MLVCLALKGSPAPRRAIPVESATQNGPQPLNTSALLSSVHISNREHRPRAPSANAARFQPADP